MQAAWVGTVKVGGTRMAILSPERAQAISLLAFHGPGVDGE
jgi:hypothetical protein